MSGTRKLVFLSMLVALGGALHLAEALIPVPLPVPGVKLGLANVATLMALHYFGLREGMTVAVGRVFLGAILGGFFLSPSFFLSLAGALGSTLIMSLLMRHTRCFSLIGISMAGAASHNVGQLLGACLLLRTFSVLHYLPVLLVAAVPSGALTGHVLKGLLERVEALDVLRKSPGSACPRQGAEASPRP